MRAKRVDANHAEIRDYFRSLLGKENVKDCSRFGEGFPDLQIWYGFLVMGIEIKTATGKLTAAQERSNMPMRLVRSTADADESVRVLKRWSRWINEGTAREMAK